MKTEWIHVTAFKLGEPARHLSMRLTRSGRVNLHDVNRRLRGTGYTVPIRYLHGGVRALNPDVGWPPEYRWEGEPPEEYAALSAASLEELRREFTTYDPAKLTVEERELLCTAERRILAGKATPQHFRDREVIRAAMAERPFTGDEW